MTDGAIQIKNLFHKKPPDSCMATYILLSRVLSVSPCMMFLGEAPSIKLASG